MFLLLCYSLRSRNERELGTERRSSRETVQLKKEPQPKRQPALHEDTIPDSDDEHSVEKLKQMYALRLKNTGEFMLVRLY